MAELTIWEKALGNILDSLGNIAPKEDEYIGEDGLPYCVRCKTPRAGVVDKERGLIMYHMSRCQKEQKDEERRREESEERRKQVMYLRQNSMLGEYFINCTFSALTLTKFNNEAIDKARRYCKHAEEMLAGGYGIYIHGACGVGKTTLAACIANRLTEQCHTVWFTSLLEILSTLKAGFDGGENAAVFNKIAQVDFLFLDDVGTEGLKKGDGGWLQSTVFDIVNRRYNAKKPVIFTGNYSVDDLPEKANFAQRTAQRIAEMGTMKLDLGKVNMRRISEESGRTEMEKILEENPKDK